MEWQPLGRHRIRREGFVFWLETHGELTPDDAGRLLNEIMAFDRQEPRLGVLVDVRGGFAISPEARRVIAIRAEEEKQRPTMPLAIIGASLPVRALLMLLINAVGLIRRRRQLDLSFFSTEAEAVAWMEPLTAKRVELLAAQQRTTAGP